MKGSILLVFAHPDEESTSLSGTILKYTKTGVKVDLICATGGEKGTRLDIPDDTDTATVRESELRAATSITGIQDIFLLGYIDGELHLAETQAVAGKIIKIAEETRPEIMITFGPDGISGHLDHLAIHKAATKAFEKLLSKNLGLRKLYYVTIPDSYIPNYREFGITTRPDGEVNIETDISEYLETKIKVMSIYKSQEDARGFVEMLKQNREAKFANTEALYLAYPNIQGKEQDLFQ